MESVTFSLLEFVPIDRTEKRLPLAMILAVAIGLTIVVLSSLLPALPKLESGEWQSSAGLTFIYSSTLVLGGVAFLLLITPRFVAGATNVTIDDAGVHLLYRMGGVHVYHWDDPSTAFILYDFGDYPLLAAGHNKFYMTGRYVWSRRTLLPREALVCIVDAARASGARVTERRGNEYFYGWSPKLTDIRGRAR